MNKNPESRIQESESGIQGTDEKVIAWLKGVPAEQVSHDLAPEILAKVKGLSQNSSTPWSGAASGSGRRVKPRRSQKWQ